ncbi:MAG TPA: COR domain-containing protein [Nitrospinota bacterium]|nr:COR domain-containing protein [Nitrospinota bacterium]|tara:strand:+ start:464 stop:3169 length:2706 start_codon:yes stop_codon:yes gene_type:complete
MSKTPEWALKKIKEAKEKQLWGLDLNGKDHTENEKLTDIPEEVFELEHLKSLDLSINLLKDIPESIIKLKNLTILDISCNEFSNFPESILPLQNLNNLHIDANNLTSIPDSIKQLQQLTVLFLATNQFHAFPTAVTLLKNLKYLYLYKNQINNVPESIVHLKKLFGLHLWNNNFTSIPEIIYKLTSLKELDFGNYGSGTNQITEISPKVLQLRNLEVLALTKNPIKNPPAEIVNSDKDGYADIEKIKNYFRQLEEEGEDYLHEAKMLIVGEPGAGKTTLAKKIENRSYKLLKKEKSTEGIDITQWMFNMEKGKPFRINIWDFGGQEIYHATHQFFLTKRSLYVLVADMREEDTDFYYWMNVVEHLSDNSPLLVIKNEKQDRQRQISEHQLRGLFSNFKETLRVNLATNRGLKNVIKSIEHHIIKLPHIGTSLPKTWTKVRKILEGDKRNHIGIDEYMSICKTNGFSRKKDKLQLSGYLHDLGVCLHFQEDPLLKKTVILDPNWGTDAVYKVLDNKRVIRNHGKFNTADLSKIWKTKKYADMHDELLQLMLNFKLCYQIENSNDYIAPQWLSDNKPDYDWDKKNNLIMQYTYEFMPKGIAARFIVAMHRWISNQKLVWKSGVVLEKDGAKGEVSENYDKRDIQIRVSGRNKKELMTIVSYELDNIHNSYKRLKVKKWIPCNCVKCNKINEPHFYAFEDLQNFLTKREYGIQCLKSFEMVNVLGLIDDVMLLKEVKSDEPYSKGDVIKALTKEGLTLNIDARSFQSVIQDMKNVQKQTTEINIEIKNHIDGLSKAFSNMKEDMVDELDDEGEKEKLGNELKKVDDAIEEAGNLKTREEAKSSAAMDRLQRFITKLGDTSTKAGKAIKAVEDGVGYAQDLAENYNKIAQWCGLPVVPDPFLKKK